MSRISWNPALLIDTGMVYPSSDHAGDIGHQANLMILMYFFKCVYIYISNRYIKIYIYIHTHDTAIFGGSMKISPNHPKKAAVNDRPYLLSGQPVGSNLWGSTLKAIRGVVGGGGGPYASCCLSPLKLEPFKRGQWDPRKIPNLRGML